MVLMSLGACYKRLPYLWHVLYTCKHPNDHTHTQKTDITECINYHIHPVNRQSPNTDTRQTSGESTSLIQHIGCFMQCDTYALKVAAGNRPLFL